MGAGMSAKNNSSDKSPYIWALLRISTGFIFLWAFLDKMFGLGFATCRDATTSVINSGCADAWTQGGSPTTGFLGNAVTGPFADFYHNLAGLAWVDWLFMLGLLFVGVGLMFGIFMIQIGKVNEIQADRYALKHMTNPQGMISATEIFKKNYHETAFYKNPVTKFLFYRGNPYANRMKMAEEEIHRRR